ncbi:TetR/AcrR family transcriptional regulator [Nocardia sp. alder85J]|uniref:TetR/AcrR family transcriptional regulator n=1 Tax=Nocardia sp. alder85J TaxID=2862949 RepID=UPI001CD3D2C5|nr:TetR/AcrR family transcriptional regulator [Nocardia sp. alder85J]MCX4097650.1 TetR/AcrR family transcriptional regulator [Nocardia sp. alder85J]
MDSTSGGRDTGTRTRILRATYEVLSRTGYGKLSLSDVATQAKISRPTLYRLFSSKEDLLAAFGEYELRNVEAGLRRVVAGLTGAERLDAVLRFIVESQSSYRLSSLVQIEPDHVLSQMNRVVPMMRALLEPLVPHGDPVVVAGAVVRLAVSHYLVGADDQAEFLAQLRLAAGISGSDQPS